MKKDNVLVISDVCTKKSEKSLMHLLSKASDLAEELGVEVDLCIFGTNVESTIEEAKGYGADNIIVKSFKDINEIADEDITNLSYELIREIEPKIVLFPITVRMKCVSARLAARLETGLTADCIDFSIDKDSKLLLQKRPAFEGRILATIVCPDRLPQMATANADIFELKPRQSKNINVINMTDSNSVNKNPSSIIKIEKIGSSDFDENNQSKIVIGVGRGVSKKVLEVIKVLAKKINANLVASRAVVDNGLLEYKYQVGLSGREISCETYIAFGISGMMQHMTGIKSYKTLVAVNTDINARIMSVANYAICDTAENVVNDLLKYINNKK